MMNKEGSFQIVNSLFKRSFKWSFFGSILFESSNILHNSLLLFILGAPQYGLLGTLFSIIYLVINIVDLGFESSFASFLHIITKNKHIFRKFIFLYIAPQCLVLLLGSFGAFFLYSSFFLSGTQGLPKIFFLTLILSEGIRIFLRRFLHNLFLNKKIVIMEQALAILYYGTVWIFYGYFHYPLTFSLVFIPYFLNSILGLFLFVRMLVGYYQTLPLNKEELPQNFWKRVIKNRYYNYLINVESFIISGNFLVPFFATTFSLQQAGLFKIASIVSHSIQALVKAAIHFPGNALLAHLRASTHKIKKQAFYVLSKKLNQIILFIFIFITTNYHMIYLFYQLKTPTKQALWYSFIFIGTTLVHQLFVVYEQFYIIEEFTNKLFIIKSIEFVLFYIFLFATTYTNPLTILIKICLIQLFCFALLILHAYRTWKIKPSFSTKPSFIIISMFASFIFSLFLHFITQTLS